MWGGGNLMHFLMFFCILGVFLGGIWDSGGIPPGDSWKLHCVLTMQLLVQPVG